VVALASAVGWCRPGIEAAGESIAQSRLRLVGETPPAKTRRVSLHDGHARPIRKGSLATPTQSATPAKSPTTGTAS
jgi:IS5 family transposase